MEAANALTSLAKKEEPKEVVDSESQSVKNDAEKPKDEAASSSSPSEEAKSETKATSSQSAPVKRFIPEHKKPDAALTFPEKVSLLVVVNFS